MRHHPLIKACGSLKLTVVLLGLSMALVFFGTLDQTQLGIHAVQQRYFESFFVLYPYTPNRPGFLPLPGGFLLGGLLLLNLFCAHWIHFRPRWKNLGISLIHGGLVLLILSGFLTSFFQRDSQMAIIEGEQINYAFTQDENELVFTDTSASTHNTEVRIPTTLLSNGQRLEHPSLPFTVNVETSHPNARLYPQADSTLLNQLPHAYPSNATEGLGKTMSIAVEPRARDLSADGVNTATALISLSTPEGSSLGRWLVSNVFDNMPGQTFDYADKHWLVELRFKRYYNPYWVELLEVRHDTYPGTDIPKNYSSRVRLSAIDNTPLRQALIYMNHPLRYAGLTYYQSGVNPLTRGTVLQVVENPSWSLPYIAILLIGLGLLYQFSHHLLRYLSKRANAL